MRGGRRVQDGGDVVMEAEVTERLEDVMLLPLKEEEGGTSQETQAPLEAARGTEAHSLFVVICYSSHRKLIHLFSSPLLGSSLLI